MLELLISEQARQVHARHIQRTWIVVLRSLPILIPVLLISIILVFTDQGRGFLTIVDNEYLALPFCALGVVAGFFAQQLAPIAPRHDPIALNDWGGHTYVDDATRQFRHAQISGSLIVGLIAAMLIPCFIEGYLGSNLSQLLPSKIREELYGSARYTARIGYASVLIAVNARNLFRQWRGDYISDEDKASKDSSYGYLLQLLIIILFLDLTVSNNFLWGFRACFTTACLFLLCLFGPLKLSNPSSAGAAILPSIWVISAAALCLAWGFLLNIWPAALTWMGSVISGVSAIVGLIALFVLLQLLWLYRYRNHPFGIVLCTVPIIIGLLVWFKIGLFSERPVRELAEGSLAPALTSASPPPTSAAAPRRETLEVYVQHWLDDRREEMARLAEGDDRPYPIYIVAAPGGGIRAAYWTAGVLGALQDEDRSFARHVLAISGVSGGSVGAGVFAALARSGCNPASDVSSTPTATPPPTCRASAAKILAADLLAPAIYSMFSRDLVSGNFSSLPDRATALEQAMEGRWREVMNTDSLAQSFDAMWDPDSRARAPGLFFNVTNAGSGERLVLGPASVAPGDASPSLPQRILEDRVFRLSTAMVLGARFPYVSPEGSITGKNADGTLATLRVVDGGLSDNSGLETVSFILKAVAAAKSASKIRIYILNIENSPLSAGMPANVGAFRTPLLLYGNMVGRLAAQSKQQLEQEMGQTENTVVLDDVRPEGGKSVFLLGWTLPRMVRSDMDQQIQAELKRDRSPLTCVLQELAPPGANPETASATVLSPNSHCFPAKKPS
jgi:hypothetical protein